MSELILRKLERPTDQNSESTLKTVLIGVVVVVALYLGRDVLVPIALAGEARCATPQPVLNSHFAQL